MMENSRFDYLRNIGVDVWTRRENIARVSSVQASSPPPAESVVAAKSGAQTVVSTLAVPDQVNQLSDQVEANAENATGIPALRAIAAQLKGAEPSQVDEDRAGAGNADLKDKDETPPMSSEKETVAPSPEFLFCFLDYVPAASEGVTLVFSLPYKSQSLPLDVRQFSDDIARVIFGESVSPLVGELRWPLVRSAHIVQTELEARAVVLDRVKRCQRKLILFGETIQGYIVDEHGIARHEVYKALDYAQYWAAPRPENESSVSPKYALWRLVGEVRSALRNGAQDIL